MLTGPDLLVVLNVPFDGPQGGLPYNLLQCQGQTARPGVPGILLPALIANLQSTRTSSVRYDSWQMMESGLVRTSTSSLSTLGWIPSGPMGLCVSKWCSRSLTISSWIIRASLYSLPLSSSSGGWIPQEKLVLLLETEAKKALSTLAFPSSLSLCFPPHPIKDGDSP